MSYKSIYLLRRERKEEGVPKPLFTGFLTLEWDQRRPQALARVLSCAACRIPGWLASCSVCPWTSLCGLGRGTSGPPTAARADPSAYAAPGTGRHQGREPADNPWQVTLAGKEQDVSNGVMIRRNTGYTVTLPRLQGYSVPVTLTSEHGNREVA